jgi:L-rhamnose mutarotase
MSSIKRSIQALDLLARKGPLGVRAVAQQLALPLGSVHRMLVDLEDEQVVERTPDGEWELSFRLLAISGLQLDRLQFSRLAHPFAEKIAEATKETVNINALHGMHGVCIDKVRGNEGMQLDLRIGSRGPLHLGGAGKAMLAYMTEADQRQIVDGALEAFAEVDHRPAPPSRGARPHPPARLLDRRPGGRDGRLVRCRADRRPQRASGWRPQHHRSFSQESRPRRHATCRDAAGRLRRREPPPRLHRDLAADRSGARRPFPQTRPGGSHGMTHRQAWVMTLKPGYEAIYKEKHDAIWPEMLANMKRDGVISFSIYLYGLKLFAYLERETAPDPGGKPNEVTWRWWEMMAPYMETNPDTSPVMEPVEEMFHVDRAGKLA